METEPAQPEPELGEPPEPELGEPAEPENESVEEAAPSSGAPDGIRMEGPPGESGPERRARIERQMAQKRAKKEAAAEAERERQQLVDHFLIISAKVAGMGGAVAVGDTCCCVSPAPVQDQFEADSEIVAELAVGEEIQVLEVKAIDGDSRQLRVRSDRGWTSLRSATEMLLEKKIVQGNDLRFDLHLGYPRGTPRPGAVEHFCYPVDVTTVGAPPGQYTFMMTLDGGDRQFGFCRTLIQPDGYQTLIIMTRYPWFSVFTPLLEALEIYSGRGHDVMERILDSAVEACRDSFPRPGQQFRATLERATGEALEKTLLLTRPSDDSTPLADAEPDFYMLFQALSVPAVMAVFRALLSECRIIMISEDLVRLSTCMYSICSLVFPFAWQNIFVPIIPEMFLDYCTAPMPFIVGVHTSLMPQVERIPGIEDEVVMVNLDTNEVSLDMSTLKELPAEEEAKLAAQVTRLFTELTAGRGRFFRKKTMSAATFNASIEDAFNQFMLSIFGQYRRFLDPTNNWEFDIDAYTDPSTKHGVFLNEFRESQMFEAWCNERSELARKKFPSANKFESQVSTIVRKGGESKHRAESQVSRPSAESTLEPAAANAEEEYAVGYGSKGAVVRVEDNRIQGGWATLWLELDGDTLSWYDVEDGKPVGKPLAVIPCEYTKTSDPKSAREDAPFAFRVDVETTQTAGGAGMHQGWLTKRGGLRKGGKRRWCQMQLQGLELAYYDQQPASGGQLKGEINLAGCEGVSRGEEEGRHTIELTERSDTLAANDSGKHRTHVFECEDEESCGQWFDALNQALEDIRSGVDVDQPLTPGVDRRIRTGTQFRKKYIIAAQDSEEKMHWLSALGGNARGRRRFAAVRGKGSQLVKLASSNSSKADDEDGMMLIEPQNMIQSIFLDCDKDDDGFLSASEYSSFLRTIESWGKHKYTDDNWAEQWPSECKSLGADPDVGIDNACFSSLYVRYRNEDQLRDDFQKIFSSALGAKVVAPPSARDSALHDEEDGGAAGKMTRLANDVGHGVSVPLRASLAR